MVGRWGGAPGGLRLQRRREDRRQGVRRAHAETEEKQNNPMEMTHRGGGGRRERARYIEFEWIELPFPIQIDVLEWTFSRYALT